MGGGGRPQLPQEGAAPPPPTASEQIILSCANNVMRGFAREKLGGGAAVNERKNVLVKTYGVVQDIVPMSYGLYKCTFCPSSDLKKNNRAL